MTGRAIHVRRHSHRSPARQNSLRWPRRRLSEAWRYDRA